jgi:hypothetical protein
MKRSTRKRGVEVMRPAEASEAEEDEDVTLVFPYWDREVLIGDEWKCWSVCGGLVGGKGSNHFCSNPLLHGGVGSSLRPRVTCGQES